MKKLFVNGLVLSSVLLVPVSIAAQKKPSSSPATTVATSTTKKGVSETTCDGALDIVPTQALSFARKRRPVKAPLNEAKPARKLEDSIQK